MEHVLVKSCAGPTHLLRLIVTAVAPALDRIEALGSLALRTGDNRKGSGEMRAGDGHRPTWRTRDDKGRQGRTRDQASPRASEGEWSRGNGGA